MVRIGIDARFYGTEHTGLGRYTKNTLFLLTNELKSHQLFVFLHEPYFSKLKFGPHVVKIHTKLKHYSFSEQLALPLLIARHRLDIWFSFHFLLPVFSPVTKITVIHDLIKSYSTGPDTTTRSPLLYQLKRWGYQIVISEAVLNSHRLIVPSNSVKNDLLASFNLAPEKIIPIPEAPDPQLTVVKPQAPATALPQRFFLYVGNAYPHKNLSTLLRAISTLDDAQLVLVTSPTPYLSKLLNSLSRQTRTRLTLLPKVNDATLKYLYLHAQALVTPSFMEGFGLSGIEALSLGTKVIAADIPIFREVYGKLAHYFPASSAPELAKLLSNVQKLDSPTYDSPHSWPKLAHQIGKVVNESCLSL